MYSGDATVVKVMKNINDEPGSILFAAFLILEANAQNHFLNTCNLLSFAFVAWLLHLLGNEE